MIKPIVRDTILLSRKAETATPADKQVITDLMDTLRANSEHCVGMAANMIGVNKRIIVYSVGPFIMTMVNPVIVGKSGKFETEEGCLSLTGTRKTTRYRNIDVQFLDQNFKPAHNTYTGWTAQIIQHEIDHCEGILI